MRKSINVLFLISGLILILLPGTACSQLPDNSFDITLAPIHEVKVSLLKSNPPQVSVYIKGGLRDSCASFNDAVFTREGNTMKITVTTKHKVGVACAEIYGYFEKNINLGSTFIGGTLYRLKVNDYTTTFQY